MWQSPPDRRPSARSRAAPVDFTALPRHLQRDLRSDHAGETGAVGIYQGILAISRDPQVRAFAAEHLRTEARHLAWFEAALPRALRTRLAGLCRLAGWLTGALPALFGARAVFATIDAVERFVDAHYAAQIAQLGAPEHAALRSRLIEFQDDEVAHQQDAAARLGAARRSRLLRGWLWLVAAGSAAGVAVARRV